MIREGTGNLLEAQVDALVNTVNTVGVMGKGIALQFKRAFPENYKAYQRACDRGEVQLGHVYIWDAGPFVADGPRFIVNFPTKAHWRSKSKLADIQTGLDDLVVRLKELPIRSIAVPPLGCGHGGLRWSEVRPRILAAFEQLPDLDVVLYPPVGAPPASQQPNRTERPGMTPGRAALVAVMGRYLPFSMGVTAVDIQKLMYFMQEAGEHLRLDYAKGRYGPYADNLRHVLSAMEGHYIQGTGDGSHAALATIPFELLAGATEAASEVLASQPETSRRLSRVANLVEGFESTYGLELLATVHWAATRDDAGGRLAEVQSSDVVLESVKSWNHRKGRLFTEHHVRTAETRLREHGWLHSPTSNGLFEKR